MSPSIIASTSVPAVLKYEFNVEKVVDHNGRNALKCAPETGSLCFLLFMAGDDEDTAPTLSIQHWPSDSGGPITEPIYPFVAAEMPEKVQGLINMAEQWLIYLDCNSF